MYFNNKYFAVYVLCCQLFCSMMSGVASILFSVEMMQLIFLAAVETDYVISNSTVAKNTQL
jgi:hypothetical protein